MIDTDKLRGYAQYGNWGGVENARSIMRECCDEIDALRKQIDEMRAGPLFRNGRALTYETQFSSTLLVDDDGVLWLFLQDTGLHRVGIAVPKLVPVSTDLHTPETNTEDGNKEEMFNNIWSEWKDARNRNARFAENVPTYASRAVSFLQKHFPYRNWRKGISVTRISLLTWQDLLDRKYENSDAEDTK